MYNIAVFISGNGTTLKRIIDAEHNKEIELRVKLVVSSNDNANGLLIAEEHNIQTLVSNNPEEIIKVLEENEINYIILAGYLKKISLSIIERYSKKIINVHPSLLPKYGGQGMYGINVHKAVIDAGEKTSGATVHYVDKEYDTGEIIDQCIVNISPNETAESLQEKIKKEEKELLINVLKKFK
ncbi:MAG: phosphoribosylglycinamide formyltransferase [Mollicutes bacterium]|nr:phosphoribosylglycinamide formyltransferase [Mollicutes bacterium]